uniref:Uncharacterized protein n=1 Tax=viral metagenome TaxID=1070528 RepID=A0A6M3LUP3_9ZZZZ
MTKEDKEICQRCGNELVDDYPDKNELNKRIWCNKCVDSLWEDRNKK